ncbi:MAG: acyl-CoA dehydrogenase family protein [Candidatus Hydrothermarchaeota archaeon]
MDFELNEDQKEMRKKVREFAEKEIAPLERDLVKEGKPEFPEELVGKLNEVGLWGLSVPEQYGGLDVDGVSYAIAIEEIARVSPSIAIVLFNHTANGTLPILIFGSDEQKEKYLPKLASGEYIASFALTEPVAGSDVSAIQSTAERDGDEYVLNGHKWFITNAFGDIINVFAYTNREKGTKGMSCFIVEKGTPGMKIGRVFHIMGAHSTEDAELLFENCRVPKENLIGNEGDGFKIALHTLDHARIGLAATCLGISQGSLEASIRYAKERNVFGAPIANLQAIQWMIADMATELEAARMLVYRAGSMKKPGARFTTEAAMAKLFASEAAMRAASKAIQIHGSHGTLRNLPITKLTEIMGGTSEVMRMVIARSFLK